MADLASHAKLFASPTSGSAAGAVRKLAAGRLSATRRRLASALAQAGDDAAAGALLSFTAGAGSAWRPETGLALLAQRRDTLALAALQLGAALGATGGAGAVSGVLESPRWLYLDGWLLPVEGPCSVVAGGGSMAIRSDLGSAIFSLSAADSWAPVEPLDGPWASIPSGGLAPRYITVTGLRNAIEGFPWLSTPPPVRPAPVVAPAPRVAFIHGGWQLIAEKTPIFGAWVASTAAGCLLLEPSGTHEAQSGSCYDHPGLIAIEPPSCPVFCGEILVHECSHQHMLCYTMVAPLVEPGSEESSYSPIKRAHRTIDRVLSGAHAVGNMILYYEELRRTMELDARSQERFDQHRSWFAEDYRPALDQSKSLTAAGLNFWQSLRDAVDSAAPR
jgi:HEXXH motif-containing protein